MHSKPLIYQHHCSTRSKTAAIVGVGALLFTLVVSSLAGFVIARMLRGESGLFPEAAFLVIVACFALLAVLHTVRDWRHPKTFGIELTPASLRWYAPVTDARIDIVDIARIDLAGDDESPRLSITTRDGNRQRVHPNCIGRLSSLDRALRETLPSTTFGNNLN